jgi:predicted O-linked N-acetylglucosamine transferase (SPINDLY family)
MADFTAHGRECERLSKPQDALEAYSSAIQAGVQVFEALKARGALLMRFGQLQHALADCIHALQHDPKDAGLWIRKGNIEIAIGRHQDGVASLRKALELAPDVPEALFGLGSAFHVMGRNQDAVNSYQAVLRRDPNHVAACSNLSTILIAHGHHAQGKQLAQRAVVAAPRFANAVFNLALCHDALGETAEAERVYRALLDIDPDHDRAMVNLGTLLGRAKRNKEAVGYFRKAMKIKPDWTLPKINAALTLREMGQEQYAKDLVAKVLEEEPHNLLAALVHAVAALPAVAKNEEERLASRGQFEDRLRAVRTSLTSATAADIETATGAIQPYYLAYHSDDNRALLAEYGSIIVDAMSRFQSLAKARTKTESDRLTVGIVTAYARKHSVWDAITKGLVKLIDRKTFRVVLFSVDPRDPCPPDLQVDQGDTFVSGHGSLSQWISAISEQSPDVLIYPEVGMNHRVLQLAALRLAPRQYAMWGHPETTGLSTIDGYFSGAAYETDDADHYYVEKLIRLPGPASFYEPVAAISDAKPDLAAPNDGMPRIVCPSAAFKFQPENDQVFVDIVKANPTADLVFFHMTKRWISERFEERLRKVFSHAGMDFDSHVTFEDWMSPNDFHRYLAGSTVVIDTMGFSGYNTAIQTLEVGTPFVAYEGRFMRGRLGAGVLRTIGMDDLVADSREAFVSMITDVVQSSSLQQAVRARIADTRHKLFEDLSVIDGIKQELLNPSVSPRS